MDTLALPTERQDLTTRFWQNVDESPGCWEWRAARNKNGYGCFWYAGRMVKAHRFAYEQLVGPIPEGLTLDHLCRNTGCVNPGHLEPVTRGENTRRHWALAAEDRWQALLSEFGA